MGRFRVGIVIPALNESATIAEVVGAASKYGVAIVVNDGSIDATATLAEQASAEVVSHDENRGYDAALNTGFQRAVEIGCDVIITMDADGQHDPTLIQKFIDRIYDGADVVSGVRSKRQRLAEHAFAWYTNLRFGLHDPLCGMKAYKVEVYRAQGYFDAYGSIGTALTIYAALNGYKIDEVPFVVRDRHGVSRFGHVIAGNYRIFRAMIYSICREKRVRIGIGSEQR